MQPEPFIAWIIKTFLFSFSQMFLLSFPPPKPLPFPPLEPRSFPPSGQAPPLPSSFDLSEALCINWFRMRRDAIRFKHLFPPLSPQAFLRSSSCLLFLPFFSLRTFSPPFIKATPCPVAILQLLCSTALITGQGSTICCISTDPGAVLESIILLRAELEEADRSHIPIYHFIHQNTHRRICLIMYMYRACPNVWIYVCTYAWIYMCM